MQLTDIPSLVPLPFANSGTKNVIPTASQIGITAGAASLTDGFPPLTFTPIAAGGVPPAGADFNGILNLLSANTRWDNAGSFYPYNSAFSTSIGGYPKGSILVRVDATGFWLSTADNNTLNPETDTSGAWVPINNNGATTLTLSNTNVTLTALQYSKDTIVLTGALLANVQIIFPATIPYKQWTVINNTTGAFTVTCKTAAGTGVVIAQGGIQYLYSEGTNILPYSGNANQNFFVAEATLSGHAVNLGRVATSAPFGAAAGVPAATSATATTLLFTAPSNGQLFIDGYGQTDVTANGGTGLSSTLAGLTTIGGFTTAAGNAKQTALLLMNKGDATTISFNFTTSTSGNLNAYVSCIFAPVPG